MKTFIASATLLLVLCTAGGAAAHGELEGTDPEDGSTVERVPAEISVTLTEAPGPGSVLRATDGCGEKVAGDVSTSESDLVLGVSSGEPGRWKASYRAISSVDGHLTRGKLSFSVKGRRDCSPAGEANKDDSDLAGGKDTRVDNPGTGDEGGSFPVVPFALGTAGVIVLALVLRRAAS